MRQGGQRRQVTFAELELRAQGARLEPLLQLLSQFLDQHDELLALVSCDLRRGLKRPDTGREGLTALQVLRAFVLQRVKNWDLRELRERVADGLRLRLFTGFYADQVPRHQAFHRAFSRLTPDTVRGLNAAVVAAAVELGIEDGSQLRVDTTVVQTNIQFPTDSKLLWDCVRVLTRLSARLAEHLPQRSGRLHNRTRCARRRMQELQRMSPVKRRTEQVPTYRALIKVTAQVVENARALLKGAKVARVADALAGRELKRLSAQLEHFAPLAERVLSQARRRVLDGEQVSAQEKLYSIFEPHTDLIKRGKPNTPVEFGHKVLLAESRRGLITDYQILAGNPADEAQVGPSLQRHRQQFGQVPRVYAADRGFYSGHNLALLSAAGVVLESIPQRGGHKTPERAAYEKSRRFKRAQKFRAGIEGRISVLGRGRGMKCCRLRGRDRFEVLVGAAVLANNLMVIARCLADQTKRRCRLAL
jgi:IS5 family transposase